MSQDHGYTLQTGHSLQSFVLQGTTSGILLQKSAQRRYKSNATVPLLSARVNENRQNSNFKDYHIWMYVGLIGDKTPNIGLD